MGMLNAAIQTVYIDRILRVGATLHIVHILLQITMRLVHLQIVRSLIQCTGDALVKLLFLHLGHLFDIRELQQQQSEERESHHTGNNPYRTFLHNNRNVF